MKLKFIHFSDTHLGFHDLELFDDEGKNIRENDVYKSMEKIVNDILEINPDFVLHTGDIFHRSTPTNRALEFAYQQIRRIVNANIPFFMIAGNHDYPKTIFTTPIHSIFSDSDSAHIFFEEKYQTFEADNFIIHTLPQINFEEKFFEEMEKIQVDNPNKPNILMMHLTLEHYLMEEFGERVFPKEHYDKLKQFDYVALGHWHKYKHLEKFGNVYYAGSSENIGEKNTGTGKGYILGRIKEDSVETEFKSVDTRRFIDIAVNGCSEKSNEEIFNEVSSQLEENDIEDSIIRIYLNDMLNTQVYEFRSQDFEELLVGVLDYRIIKTIKESGETITTDKDSFDLRGELIKYLNEEFTDKDDLKKVKDISLELLDEIEEEEANANQ